MSNYNEHRKKHLKDPFDDEVILALFRKGAREYLERDLLGDLPDSYDYMGEGPSEVFNKKIEKIIARAVQKDKRRHRIIRIPRVVAIILIVVVVCSITVMSVDALRVPFLNLFIDTHEEITDIVIKEEQVNDDDDNKSAMFGYIPGEYELITEDIQENYTAFIYANPEGEEIHIRRNYGEGSVGLDTENAEYGELLINENQGFYTLKNELSSLIFTKDGYTYLIQSTIDLSEIVKIAESIK